MQKRKIALGIRTRKLIGTVVMLVLVMIYALVAMALAQGRITTAPAWLQVILYAILGLAWVAPAALIIRWMEKGFGRGDPSQLDGSQ